MVLTTYLSTHALYWRIKIASAGKVLFEASFVLLDSSARTHILGLSLTRVCNPGGIWWRPVISSPAVLPRCITRIFTSAMLDGISWLQDGASRFLLPGPRLGPSPRLVAVEEHLVEGVRNEPLCTDVAIDVASLESGSIAKHHYGKSSLMLVCSRPQLLDVHLGCDGRDGPLHSFECTEFGVGRLKNCPHKRLDESLREKFFEIASFFFLVVAHFLDPIKIHKMSNNRMIIKGALQFRPFGLISEDTHPRTITHPGLPPDGAATI